MLEDILLQHLERYPQMEPQDAVKLIYQQEFGPGHLIRDEKKALEFLRQEMAGAGEPLPGEALYESIGNGLCRLNLRPCKAKGIPAEDILLRGLGLDSAASKASFMLSGARKQGALASTVSSKRLFSASAVISAQGLSGQSSLLRRLTSHMPMMFFW